MAQVLLSRGIKAVGSPSKINNLTITRELVFRLNFLPTVSIAQKFRSQCCNFRPFCICSVYQKLQSSLERETLSLMHPETVKHAHVWTLCWKLFLIYPRRVKMGGYKGKYGGIIWTIAGIHLFGMVFTWKKLECWGRTQQNKTKQKVI